VEPVVELLLCDESVLSEDVTVELLDAVELVVG